MASAKLEMDEVKVGALMQATFWPNPVEDSRYSLRATHLDGRRAPKVVLTSDRRIVAGIPCVVRVVEVNKADRPDRGSIVVEFVRPAPFKIEGVYLDPVISKKLQI